MGRKERERQNVGPGRCSAALADTLLSLRSCEPAVQWLEPETLVGQNCTPSYRRVCPSGPVGTLRSQEAVAAPGFRGTLRNRLVNCVWASLCPLCVGTGACHFPRP